jgi:hypothetical protein
MLGLSATYITVSAKEFRLALSFYSYLFTSLSKRLVKTFDKDTSFSFIILNVEAAELGAKNLFPHMSFGHNSVHIHLCFYLPFATIAEKLSSIYLLNCSSC